MACSPLHSNIVSGEDDITSLAVQGGAVWLGTRNGYIFLLDGSAMEDRSEPLLGLQFCGNGRVKSIVPLVPKKGVTAKLQVQSVKKLCNLVTLRDT